MYVGEEALARLWEKVKDKIGDSTAVSDIVGELTDLATTAKDTVVAAINELKESSDKALGNLAYYGTCATSASATAKVVTCSDFDSLTTGAKIVVLFTYANTASAPTLNVNSTGAKSIKKYGTTAPETYYWHPMEAVEFVYDGSNWIMTGRGHATTTYYGVTKLEDSVESTSTETAATPNAVKTAYDLANSKQSALTFDTTPTSGSTNPVTSGGVYTAIDGLGSAGGDGIYYATCSTAADTAAKEATCSTSGFSLAKGVTVAVKFTYASSVTGTLNVDSTGAKYMRAYGSSNAPSYSWRPNEVVVFVYDGSYWQATGRAVASTEYYGKTMLYDGVDSDSTTKAATPNSVKTAYDIAVAKLDAVDEDGIYHVNVPNENLILNSGEFSTLLPVFTNAGSTIDNVMCDGYVECYVAATTSAAGYVLFPLSRTLESGTYCLTLCLKQIGVLTPAPSNIYAVGDTSGGSRTYTRIASFGSYVSLDDWNVVTVTDFSIDDYGHDVQYIAIGKTGSSTYYGSSNTGIGIKYMKLEEGSTKTPWIHSPYDNYAQYLT